jgi:hypothetical protein
VATFTGYKVVGPSLEGVLGPDFPLRLDYTPGNTAAHTVTVIVTSDSLGTYYNYSGGILVWDSIDGAAIFFTHVSLRFVEVEYDTANVFFNGGAGVKLIDSCDVVAEV